jgi:uncharacterized repeat protein (TIGR02543 family)
LLFLLLILLCFTSCPNPSGGSNTENSPKTSGYTVTFKGNYGNNGTLYTRTVTPPAATIAEADFPANPTRTGYTFAGWNTRSDGSGSIFTAFTPVSADITVYARWTENLPGSYTVTFKLNDGTETVWTTKTVTPPAATITEANFPANPSRGGYTFSGWNTAFDGSGSGFTASSTINADITVYAQWTEETYTVTFKSNYGSNDTLDTRTVTVPPTTISAADFPANPSRSGYTFAGWNTAPDGSGSAFTASTTVNTDITVYARWTENLPGSYTVIFNLNDGTETNHTVKTVTLPATTIADFPADPSRTGYLFAGWNTAPDSSGNGFTASTTVNADITVYARWTPKTYTISFKSNYAPDTILYTKTVTVPATTISTADFPANPSRSGYTFAGWNTAPDGSGSAFTASTTVSADITVYAKWTAVSYTINYMLNGGTNNSANPASYTIESPGITLAAPSRTGYNFGGWYSNEVFNTAVTEILAGSTGDKTFYARWNPGASVQITLQPQIDPPLSNKSIFKDEQTVFSTGTEYTAWQWYWDGDLINGADSADYTLAANTKLPGVYELSVAVTAVGGTRLSARCRVTIKAR